MQNDPFLLQLAGAGFAACKAVAVGNGSLLASLFLAGLVGSASHCVGMCGPFVLAQTMARLERLPAGEMRELHRLAGAALVPYHLGRATTYVALGVLAGAAAQGLIGVTGLAWIAPLLLTVAALLFLGYGLQRLGVSIGLRIGFVERTWSRTIEPVSRRFLDRPTGWRGYVLGVLLGLLPCGLLYGALAAAAGGGGPLTAGLAMLAFTLGTVPALVGVGLAGHVAGSRFRSIAIRAVPVLMLANAAGLSYLAWKLAV